MQASNRQSESVLKQVANQEGIVDRYISAWGKEAFVSDTTIEELLQALGYDTSNEKTLLSQAEQRLKVDGLPSVKVVHAGKEVHVELHIASSARVSEFSWVLDTEQGERFEGYLESQVFKDTRDTLGYLTFTLPNSLPLGYHQFSLFRKRRNKPFEMSLIVTPQACFKQPELVKGQRLWGPSIQLYSVTSETNWGIGDFTDLNYLVSHIADGGGDFVGLNPIHSLFPANPEGASPYSPSSRRWLNVMYIDVEAVAEFKHSENAQTIVHDSEFQQRLHANRQKEWVDYTEVSALKMSVLPALYQTFVEKELKAKSERARAFLDFVEQGSDSLIHQAAFDALHSDLKAKDDSVWGWPVFAKEYQHFDSPEVQSYIKKNQEKVQLFMYLQWLADEQLTQVQKLAEDKGMVIGLYRDLAVGVCDSGADTWADHGALCQDVSIGAPPDIFGPLGQNWGLPPLNPYQLKVQAYQPFIDLLRANMRHCGALRIDHVLGLLRLWWIPKGKTAKDGAYIYYPVDDLMSILALESHRHQCAVIGEDLGTVPEEIVEKLNDAGIHSYKVFFFETEEDGQYIAPNQYKQQSMTALCTHDMPTLRGFWNSADLTLGKEIGLYPDEAQLNVLFEDRKTRRKHIIATLKEHHHLPELEYNETGEVIINQALSEAMQVHMATGSSALLSLQLEDWLEMDTPVNIPGTMDEYPNWRRKLSSTLQDMFDRADIQRLETKLTQARS
ncbi:MULTISPECIES: 4-alpha-glucanotransferase [Vibrio]|uniref:4-alpha-glucanotransferase n=1 Tax=Vibrio casei TaxID=673372 RepID=A0A368LI98_9VIBR|nr:MULTISPECIES: 4-alpha-glucanotransferase [Vibrio]RCS70472.1 4-alpha-glucanotransferase [Vibrio casei]SJN28160.1 4-alpha-glucanotransferase (amylomaltase) [Vibrio casei]HBV77938.1 4-alpha-glucanotransferase [Vibrio sp.]